MATQGRGHATLGHWDPNCRTAPGPGAVAPEEACPRANVTPTFVPFGWVDRSLAIARVVRWYASCLGKQGQLIPAR
jgi:hypothetical protein